MNALEQMRALFEVGGIMECVENTYLPMRNGEQREITKVGKTIAHGVTINGKHPYSRFRFEFPRRVSDVIEVDESSVTYKLANVEDGHTVTLRKVS